jgi:hypothetical protein
MDLKKLLEDTRNLPPVDGKPVFSFKNVGDAIVAKYDGMRQEIKTKKSDSAMAIDVDVLESVVTGGDRVTGPCTIWGSTHLQQIFSQQQLEVGKIFILRLASVDLKSGFKKFFFKIVDGEPVQSYDDDNPF